METLVGGQKPKVVRRRGGWTEAKRKRFLEKLAMSCNVAMACRRARVSSGSVYRERQANAAFRAGWAEALREGYARLELMMLERALDGTVKEVRHADGRTDKIVEYSDRIGLQLLKQHKDAAAPEARDASEAEADEGDDICQRIMRRIDGVRRRMGLPEDGPEAGDAGAAWARMT